MKTVRLAFVLLWLGLVPGTSQGGKIAELFGEGVFGLQWGATLNEVQMEFPGGKVKEHVGIQSYWVKDDRTILGVGRDLKNEISFVFNPDGNLAGVGIEFPKGLDAYAELFRRATETFGSPEPPGEPIAAGLTSVISTNWTEDQGIRVQLVVQTRFKMKNSLNITAVQAGVEEKTKNELGFGK